MVFSIYGISLNVSFQLFVCFHDSFSFCNFFYGVVLFYAIPFFIQFFIIVQIPFYLIVVPDVIFLLTAFSYEILSPLLISTG